VPRWWYLCVRCNACQEVVDEMQPSPLDDVYEWSLYDF
jgi:predicted nucleic acid-binding Zn ribbon protein